MCIDLIVFQNLRSDDVLSDLELLYSSQMIFLQSAKNWARFQRSNWHRAFRGKKKGNRIPCNTRTLRNTLKWFQQVNPSPHCRWKTLLLLPTRLGENSVFIPGLAIGMGLSLWVRHAIQVSKKMPPQQWFTPLQHCVSNRATPFGGTPFSPPVSLSSLSNTWLPGIWQRRKPPF